MINGPMKRIRSLVDLTPDPKNANAGTKRGREMVVTSLEQCGAGRSILVDKYGVVIAGNTTLRAAREVGLDVEVVQTTGHELVVVQRTDLDLAADDKARLLAYADNRTSEVGLAWDPAQIRADIAAGVDVGVAFFPNELAALTESAADAVRLRREDVTGASVDPLPPSTARPQGPLVARYEYQIVFDTPDQQARWTRFVKGLRATDTDAEPAALVLAHIGQTVSALVEAR